MPAGVSGTVEQVQERVVRAQRIQSPHGENERAVQNPSYNTHNARWNSALEAPTKFTGFRGDDLFHIHSMRCGGNEPNNLEDNKYEHDDG